MLTLTAGTTRAVVDPQRGGRLRSLVIDGRELLMPANPAAAPVLGGCYPMLPWAGRVRDGRFTHEGIEVQLELDAPPHALHGLAYRRPWSVTAASADAAELAFDLGAAALGAAALGTAGWPFGGTATQSVRALHDGVEVRMAVTAGDTPLPLVLGWHPWVVRHLAGIEGHAVFDAGAMLERGADGLPTGALVEVGEGPWDDCMVEVSGTPAVVWPGLGRLEVASDLDHLVVFDGYAHGICLEPQSGPPDAVNLPDPPVLAPRARAEGWMALRWRPA